MSYVEYVVGRIVVASFAPTLRWCFGKKDLQEKFMCTFVSRSTHADNIFAKHCVSKSNKGISSIPKDVLIRVCVDHSHIKN